MPPMRYLLTSLCLIALCLASHPSHADTLPAPDSVEPKTRGFMQQVANGKVTEAYGSLAPYLGVSQEPFDASAKEADTYFKKVFDRAGKTLDIARVKREAIDDHFYRETWLQKFAEAAMAWQFTFYQATDGWKLVGISYTTDIESLYSLY
ncbi:hypothetical protein RE428_39330 [Marinobacter nanhaiticus D15-8W]|uniref:DUF4864 domain-containing protein n=1 Tax=Marinobacter nanhaiticus D15-8W TaxID=626887 RepID=N6W7P1_9GAMM|nr:hypothetical protein [Marinobacter nanhaiticus]ENO16229.1 hypothetical protein J057_12771 [Marinobacter nanhaiticus D15-8W]BES72915.1 hypothetical protein RE428_39330 [Marinobacter nanhaiticus D15-8W]